MTDLVSKRNNFYERHKKMGFDVTCSSAHKDLLNMHAYIFLRILVANARDAVSC
jgi:hypothetical protein